MTAITKLDRIDLGFNARESDKIDATARMLFDRSRVRPEVAAAMGAARPGSLGGGRLRDDPRARRLLRRHPARPPDHARSGGAVGQGQGGNRRDWRGEGGGQEARRAGGRAATWPRGDSMITINGRTIAGAAFGAPNIAISDERGSRRGWSRSGRTRDDRHRGGALAETVAAALADARSAYATGEWEHITLGPWVISGLDREDCYTLRATHWYEGTAIGEFDHNGARAFLAYSYNTPDRLRQATHHATLAEAQAEVRVAQRIRAAVQGEPLDRAAYERACADYRHTPAVDDALVDPRNAYALGHWAGRWPEYPLATHVAYALDRRRRAALVAERAAARPAAPPRRSPPEEVSIRCRRCGAFSGDGAMFTTLGHELRGGDGICDDCA